MGACAARRSALRISSLSALAIATLVTAGPALAQIDLLGRTQATFRWEATAGDLAGYEVYVACGAGVAPDSFPATPSAFVSADLPEVVVPAAYGMQCKLRVLAVSTDGRVSALSLPSDLVNFVAPEGAENDFDGDGYSDIIVQDPDDGSALLISGGDVRTGDKFLHTRTTISTIGTELWDIVDTGDFNGDGNPDFLWFAENYHENFDFTTTTYTYIAGSHIYDTVVVLNDVTDSEEVIAVADFDGNGADDVLHRTNDVYGTVYVTFMGPSGVVRTSRYDGVLQSQFDFVAAGDFDGDGDDDVMWRRIESGQTVVWLMGRPGRMTLANSGVLLDGNWLGEAAANFNNAIEHDVLWRNVATGEVLVWYMDELGFPEEALLGAATPANWTLLATGDMDGDGRGDLTWFNESTHRLEIWRMDESAPAGFRVE